MANTKSRFNFSQSKRKNFGINKSLAKPMQMVMLIKYIDEVIRENVDDYSLPNQPVNLSTIQRGL
jgi:hypothetical protein